MLKNIVFLFALPGLLMGAVTKRDKMVNDLEVIRAIFSTKYAPAKWKGEYCGWDLDQEIDEAQIHVAERCEMTTKEYQELLRNFFNSTKDYHVGAIFYSTEKSYLPFRVEGANGRYFVAWIHPEAESALAKEGFTKGSEIIYFDGIPADEAVHQFKTVEFGQPTSKTDQALAEAYLTLRLAACGHNVPKSHCDVQFLSKEGGTLKEISMRWIYFPENIGGGFLDTEKVAGNVEKKIKGMVESDSIEEVSKQLNQEMLTPLSRLSIGNMNLPFNPPMVEQEAGAGLPIGVKEGFLPQLGPVSWEASSFFCPYHAYIFKSRDGFNIGYLRIHTFMDKKDELYELARLIKKFERKTSALVIDQMSNGGGNLYYLYGVLSYLSDEPIALPKGRFTITQSDVHRALVLSPYLRDIDYDFVAERILRLIIGGLPKGGIPIDKKFAKGLLNYYDFILSEWIAGRLLTEPYHLHGVETVMPNTRGVYTKPIIVLANELDFSCADFFPAILQDNGRAKVIGTKTSGAGGTVESHSYPNHFGLKYFSLTTSIFERSGNQEYIENLGITPDVTIEVTEKDLQEGYVEYVEALNDEIDKLDLQPVNSGFFDWFWDLF